MIFLIAAIAVSCTIVFTFKVANIKGWNSDNITLVNYICATFISVILCAAQGLFPAFLEIKNVDFSTLGRQMSVPNSMFFILILGIITGTLYVVNISLVNKNVINNGAGISTLFSRSGFLISIALSVILFGERVTWLRLLGAGLTIFALAIAGGVGSGKLHLTRPLLLIGSLCCIGFLDANNKAYSALALPEYKANFTAITFTISLLIFGFLFYQRTRGKGKKANFKWQEILAGIIMGVPNAFGNIFQILALNTIPASVMFPTMAAGSLLISTLLSAFVFKEPFGKRQILSVSLTTISLVLVNLSI